MSSSISSSDSIARGPRAGSLSPPFRRCALGVLALLLTLEIAVRIVGPQAFSLDLKHIEDLPRIAATRPTVLFAGSSVVREDLDMSVLGHQRFMLDDATVPMWYFGLKRYFLRPGGSPRFLILCFVNDHLEGRRVNSPELARYFTDSTDIRFLFTTTLSSFSARADFLLDKVSVLYSLRERIGRRLLWMLIPGYESAARSLHQAAESKDPGEGMDFLYLRLLAQLAGEHESEVLAVWLPTRQPQQPRPALQAELKRLRIPLIDLSHSPELDPSCFRDNLHLKPECTPLLSAGLRTRLDQLGVP